MTSTHNDLRQWLLRNGVRWSGVAIHVDAAAYRGACIVSTRPIRAGEHLALIPKALVLSCCTASCSLELAALLDAGCSQSSALALAIAHERKLGTSSRWDVYFRNIGAYEPLPLLWEEAELEWLRGTGVAEAARERRRALLDDFASIQVVLRSQPQTAATRSLLRLTPLDFLRAATVASSRAFFVDDFHGEALVPFADIFNHKCALLADGATVEGPGVDDEAAWASDDCSSSSSEEDSDDDDTDGGRLWQRAFDPRLADQRLRAAARELGAHVGLDLEMDTTLHNLVENDFGGRCELGEDSRSVQAPCEVGRRSKRLLEHGSEGGGGVVGHVALVALRAIGAGREVFNTYGELPNRSLLADYGFTLTQNPLDVAELPAYAVRRSVEDAIGGRQLRRRSRELRQGAHGETLLLRLQDGAAFKVDRTGTPPADLLFLLRVLLDSDRVPQWLPSTEATRDEARRFTMLSLSEQLEWCLSGPSPAAVVLEAVRRHLATYSMPSRVALRSESVARAQHAAQLVEDERTLWRLLTDRLEGFVASTTAAGSATSWLGLRGRRRSSPRR